jgi:hypothetical protein
MNPSKIPVRPPTPMIGRADLGPALPHPTPQMPFGRHTLLPSVPIMESLLQRRASSPQTEYIGGSLRRTQLSPAPLPLLPVTGFRLQASRWAIVVHILN